MLGLDIEGAPRHWAQAQRFLSIARTYLDATRDQGRDLAARQRAALDHLLAVWRTSPPETPVLVVGSTGSRGTTFELMKRVSTLPQGAVVLPGFDHDLPDEVWQTLGASDPPAEDHAQYRYSALCLALDVAPSEVRAWPGTVTDAERNALVSLSLRPAPVTDQWLRDGPNLGNLCQATRNMSLILAAQPHDEAAAIAVAMREAVENGKTTALVTPDRTLGRRVAAALRRWAIVPDDSAGTPLSLSPPGRLLRQVGSLLGAPVDPASLIALLRHPLVRTGGEDRGQHTLWTNTLDLRLRALRHPVVMPESILALAEAGVAHHAWCLWLAELVGALDTPGHGCLGDLARQHVAIAERMARGDAAEGAGGLWDQQAGELARSVMDRFTVAPVAEEPISRQDYHRLFEHSLARENTRQTEASRPDVQILGTLEARVLGSDLVILGALNETVWPAATPPDPWLSRQMRLEARLLSPERQIGLSAHDYQQAVAARQVILSRSSRSDDAETVPSRWLNRLTNLLSGLSEQGGDTNLTAMIWRGDRLLSLARSLDAPEVRQSPSPRPAPAPPAGLRPRQFSVTAVEKLIRDPYWIYARHVLRLRSLPALVPRPDAALRGEVFHAIVERFIEDTRDDLGRLDTAHFSSIAGATLDERVPWPAIRRLWHGHLDAIADSFISAETARRANARPLATEVKGRLDLACGDFVITGEADRIDVRQDGTYIIYDYKSGTVPTDKQAKQFNPQVPIEALMAERGAFEDVPPAVAAAGAYLSLGRAGAETRIEMGPHVITKNGKPVETVDFSTSTTERELIELLTAYAQQNRGYPSRRAMEKMTFEGDYDHLARFGEWDETQDADVIVLP